jgi:hypothetical protein
MKKYKFNPSKKPLKILRFTWTINLLNTNLFLLTKMKSLKFKTQLIRLNKILISNLILKRTKF